MLSRRAVFTFGFARLAEQLDAPPAAKSAPAPPPAGPVPAAVPRRAWPRGDAGLWAAAATALPRPAHGDLLDLDAIEPPLDVASLPFEDDRFDAAISAFGPMFSSDGRVAIDELFRVVRPGGTVGFTAWTPLGVVGRLLRLAAAHDPPAPGVPPPLAWGREERLRQELARHSEDALLQRAEFTCRFETVEQAVEHLVGALGPLLAAPRQPDLRTGVGEIVEQLAAQDEEGVVLQASYLLAEATRAPVLY